MFVDTPELCTDVLSFLASEKREWLSGKYVSCTWDMPELMQKEREIVEGDKLKMRMVLEWLCC